MSKHLVKHILVVGCYIIVNIIVCLLAPSSVTFEAKAQAAGSVLKIYYDNLQETVFDEENTSGVIELGGRDGRTVTVNVPRDQMDKLRFDFHGSVFEFTNLKLRAYPFLERYIDNERLTDAALISKPENVQVENGIIKISAPSENTTIILEEADVLGHSSIPFPFIILQIILIVAGILIESFSAIREKIKNSPLLKKLLALTLALLLGTAFVLCAPGTAYLLKSIFIAISIYSIWFVFDYSFRPGGGLSGFYENNKHQVWLMAEGLIVFFPLLTESFYYYDEYWVYAGHPYTTDITMTFGRAFQSLLSTVFGFVDAGNLYIARWFTVCCAIMLALLLYGWLCKKSDNKLLSFFIASLLCFTSAMADCVSYLAINSFIYGIILLSLSVIFFEKGFHYVAVEKDRKRGTAYIAMSVIWIFFAVQSYQLVIPFLFVMFAVEVWFEKDRKKIMANFFGYVACVLTALVGYMLSLKILADGLAMNARSEPIGSIGEVIDKIQWFLTAVLPAAFNRMAAQIFGRMLFANKNYWHFMSYRESLVFTKYIIYLVMVLICISTLCIYYRKNKKVLEVVFLALAVPGSYAVYLLLKENGYHTYYAYPLICLISFYLCIGTYEIVVRFKREKTAYGILGIILVIGLLQTNVYVRQFWIGENKASFDEIQREIELAMKKDENLSRIHVYGTPNPNQLRIYSQFAVENALNKEGLDPGDYKITCSDRYLYCTKLDEQEMVSVQENLALKEWEVFLSYYTHEGQFYYIQADINNPDILSSLYQLSTKAKLIPAEEEKAVRIDLTWVSPLWEH